MMNEAFNQMFRDMFANVPEGDDKDDAIAQCEAKILQFPPVDQELPEFPDEAA